MINKTARELAYDPEAKPEDPKEMWDAYNKHWEDQIRGKGIRVFEEHCLAKLRACAVGDPFDIYIPFVTPEIHGLIKDNMTPEAQENWRANGGKHMRDVDPERYERMVEEVTARDEAYEKAGVTIIKNRIGWTPEPILDYAAYANQKYLSLYAGARWQMADRYMLVAETAGPCKPAGVAARAAQLALIEEDPDAAFAPFLAPEPDNTVVGPGIAGLDLADWRYMPGKTIMFGLGAASKSDMEKIENGQGYLAPAGDARGRDLYMRLLSDLGIKCETWYFDSNISYHQDCIMLNVVEGVIGLPDDGKNGMWSEMPNCIKGWEILPLPLEDIKRGVANSTCLGDGRVFMDSSCTKTMDMLSRKGYEPIPIPYQTCWQTFNSGIDCSDTNIWREND